MKKLFTLLLSFVMVLSCIGTVGITAFAQPFFFAELGDGTLENGTDGWGTIHGGDIELVQPGANGTENAMKLTPSDKYNSVAFDLGPAIIDDEEAGYFGEGASKYGITFWAKGENSGKFKVWMNSQLHLADERIERLYPEIYCGLNTYIPAGSIVLDTYWQKYTLEIDVNDTYLDMIKQLRETGNNNAYRAYELALRLDGTGDNDYAYEQQGLFDYYIDEVTIVRLGDAGVLTNAGIEFLALKDKTDSSFFKTSEYVVSKADVVGGEIKKSIMVSNTGAEALDFAFDFEALVYISSHPMWAPPVVAETVTINPGETKYLTYTMPVYDYGTGEYYVIIAGTAVDVRELFMRINITDAEGNDTLSSQNSFALYYPEGEEHLLATLTPNIPSHWFTEDVTNYAYVDGFVPKEDIFYYYENGVLVKNTWIEEPDGWCWIDKNGMWNGVYYDSQEEIPEPIPSAIGMSFTSVKDTRGELNLFFMTDIGVISKDDIIDGQITKSYLVSNISAEPINIKLEIQASVLIGGAPRWAGQVDGEYILIEPLQSATLTYTMNVNNDNTVRVAGTDVDLSEFFIRFDIENEENVKSIPEGTGFIVYAEGAEYDIISKLKAGYPRDWYTEEVYDYITINGWVEEDGNYYYYLLGEKLTETWWFDDLGFFYLDETGLMVKNQWFTDELGRCYLGSDGYLVTEAWVLDSVGWCYVDETGYLVTNSWILDSVGWCYVGADGYCVTNAWVADSYGWCYLNAEGRMATNQWIMDSVGWCYVGADGYCVTNAWVQDSYGWCYLDAEGRMATNKWIMDSVGWCYVGADGYCITNAWMQDSYGWCYLDAEGRMVTNGWIQDSIGWCWLDANGYWDGLYLVS